MKRPRVITLILVFLLLAPLFLFADAINGSSDAVLLMLPRGMTYNKNDAIELTTAKSLSVSDLGNSPLTFSSRINSNESKNLGVIRFQDTLHNLYRTIASIPTGNYPYRKSSYSSSGSLDVDQMFQSNNSVILRIHTTGIFVCETDPTETRDFSLSCFVTEAYMQRDGSAYNKISNYPQKMTLNSTMTSADTVSQMYFKSLGGGDYELYLPSSPIVAGSQGYRYYPLLMRLFDLCIELPDTVSGLKEGYYKTEITIQSVTSYSNRTFSGERTYNASENKYIIESDVITTSMAETITVWGYVGTVSGAAATTYSFSVSPTNSSFSVNLGTQNYFNVATVNFYNLTGPYTATTAPVESVQKQKYKVYISPTSDYMTNGSYVFTKTNGSGTIPYDLYLDENGTRFSSNSTNGIGGSGVGSGSIPSSTYYILPTYSITKDTMNGASTKYTEVWSLSSVPIYLKVTEDNQAHSAGEYRSNVYFTLVVE